MIKSFKYRIYPNKSQEEMFNKHFGCARFIYNWGLNRKVKEYEVSKKTLSFFDLTKETTSLKSENIWLKEVNSQSLQMSLRNLDNAFTRFFREKKGFPKFKSKRNNQSFQCPQACSINFETNKLNIPKIKNIKIKIDRSFEGKIKTVTISKVPSGKYYASVLVDDRKELPSKIKAVKEFSIGVDLGIKTFATLSNGEKIDNPRHFKKLEKQLKRAQRKLSRKKKGSSNRDKTRIKVTILHERVTNSRKDFLHKLSKRLIDENQAVCLENLNVNGLLKNRRLAKHIQDAGWRTFKTFCEYKAEWSGKEVKTIGRFEPSSKLCNVCGVLNNSLTLKDREWTCSCGTIHDRDILAANNILNFAFLP
ncbi:MAG: IS200/IS605 family element RNA-guided endonuclease TnpB [Melioribacteraceae bacterium]